LKTYSQNTIITTTSRMICASNRSNWN